MRQLAQIEREVTLADLHDMLARAPAGAGSGAPGTVPPTPSLAVPIQRSGCLSPLAVSTGTAPAIHAAAALCVTHLINNN